jgi:hypothetical protein
MKKLMLTGLLLGPTGVAMAHQLPGDESLLMQLAHQVLSVHHLPLLMLALIGGIYLARRSGSRKG